MVWLQPQCVCAFAMRHIGRSRAFKQTQEVPLAYLRPFELLVLELTCLRAQLALLPTAIASREDLARW